MGAVVAAVVVGATTLYAANKASKAASASAAAQERAAAGLADSADYAADMSYKLGSEQLDFAKRQYDEMKPIAQKIADQQIAAQEQQMTQAQDYYDYNVNTFRPVEQGLVADAQRFSTEGYREQLARDAAAASARAFGQTQDMSSRAAAARGINPNSGAGMALQTQGNLGLSAQRANAMTGARSQAEQLGYARRLDVTGLGRNLPGASTAAYSGATNAGTAGINTSMAPGNQYTAAATPAFNTMTTGAGQRVSGYGTLFTGATSSANAAAANEMGLYGSVIGAGGRIAAAKAGG
jgi:predicted transglutaminase-like cysteine proteinase